MKSKKLLTFLLLFTTMATSYGQAKSNKMESERITSVVTAIFTGTDARDWQKVAKSFANKVLLDYTSMAGGAPVTLSPQEIIAAWKTILPGFDSTRHQLSNFKVNQHGKTADVTNAGHAEHYLQVDGQQESWIVEGHYSFQLEYVNNEWKVTAMKFIKEKISGNTNLPQLATEKVKKSA